MLKCNIFLGLFVSPYRSLNVSAHLLSEYFTHLNLRWLSLQGFSCFPSRDFGDELVQSPHVQYRQTVFIA